METGLNSHSSSKMRKTYKKKIDHQSKASLDEAILRQFDTHNLPSYNIRNSLQHSMSRNTFNPKSSKKEL